VAAKELDIVKGALGNIPDGVIVVDSEGRFLLFNQAAEQILGIGASQSDPADWSSNYGCYMPDKVTLFPSKELPLYRALRGERVNNEQIYIKNSKRPAGVWISVSGKPLRDDGGNIWGGMVIFRDITSRHKDRENIKVLERLCSALEQTADSIIITNRDGIIEYANAAFEETTGYSIDDAIGHNPRFLKSGQHDEQFYRNLWNEILAGRPFHGTIVNKRKSGELYWAQQTITPIKENGSITHFVSVLKDITDLIEKKDQEAKMHIAREVQQRFYGISASIPGYDIAGAAYPADETGGDYFDFIELPDNRLCIAVGDVCGHGIGAALLMTETRAYLRSAMKRSFDIEQNLTDISKSLIPDLGPGEYVTLMLCCLDPINRTLTYASAGHVPGFLINTSGDVEITLGGTGPPLGLFPNQEYSSVAIKLATRGQTLLMPTDGIMEAESPKGYPFGVEQTIDYVAAHRIESSRQIIEGLYTSVKKHTGPHRQLDDITAVLIKAM
jgi:sigma-B regulation protein RsbU (phosphoserine phosphatase)